jgi:protein SCO1
VKWRVAGVAVLALAVAGCRRAAPLPVLGTAPPFQLTAQDGQTFSSSSLAGRVWVADFIYTNCAGPCPMMSSRMARIQSETAVSPSVTLVSFTVDPARDTPPVLAEYAKHFKADPRRWHFLTGAPERLNALGATGFRLNSVDGSLEHSTRFVLVDQRGQIRGFFAYTEEGVLEKLLAAIHQLEQEKT